jgi:hypothetical protein
MQFKGYNGLVELTDEKIIIKRKGLLSFLNHGFKGDKTILIKSVTSVQFKRAGYVFNGYIQFAFSGGLEAKGGLKQATKDENTVVFTFRQNAQFSKLKEFVEQRMADQNRRTEAPAVSSTAAEIEKLAELHQRGILTATEFEVKKKHLLGI